VTVITIPRLQKAAGRSLQAGRPLHIESKAQELLATTIAITGVTKFEGSHLLPVRHNLEILLTRIIHKNELKCFVSEKNRSLDSILSFKFCKKELVMLLFFHFQGIGDSRLLFKA